MAADARMVGLGAAFLSLCGLAGCDIRPPKPPPQATSVRRPNESAIAGDRHGPFAVVEIDGPGLDAEIAKYRGQVVFVDFWALWCEPCTEFFPHTVRLHGRFATQGFTVISVSLDPLDERGAVGAFLAENDVDFPCFITPLGVGQKSFQQFHLKSGIPCFRLYGRDGRLIREWESIDSAPEEIAQEIEAAVTLAMASVNPKIEPFP